MNTPTCPKCGYDRFDVAAEMSVTAIVEFKDDDHKVLDEGHGDLTWDDDSSATCRKCGHEAPLGEMKA
jgi:DNA-directed RNA polymerase subunit M/transcription elongation factor TFIIS